MKSSYFSMPNGLIKMPESFQHNDLIPFKEEFIRLPATGEKFIADNFLKSSKEIDQGLRYGKSDLKSIKK